ncbi:MAG: MBL fold metallo-hydrolase [Lachnospiraceae bacterium]|nr:MBL fold metallo-hydrolase [Lachnospiraceae bacterium]
MDGIRIYRGINQIGGIVTEFRKGGHRILIDFGANLPGTENAELEDDALVRQVFADKDPVTDAVLFTHYHGDHVGLRNRIPQGIEMYAGATALKIMKLIAEGADHVKRKKGLTEEYDLPVLERIKPYWKIGEAKDFHGIKVTPLVCDHSALDAYMFIIELNGKRILYTGDFRAHGIPGEETFEKLIKTKVGKTDILITEGTMVSRLCEEVSNGIRTEAELARKAAEIFEAHKENVVLVSSTNIDSVMSFYNSVPSDKAFLCDIYQAKVMRIAIEARHRYFPGLYSYRGNIYVLCPDENEYCMGELRKYVIPHTKRHPFEMARAGLYSEKGFVMLARVNRDPGSETGRFEKRLAQMTDPHIIYSMWTGYLKDGKAEDPAIVSFLDGRDDAGHMDVIHTSGHAYVEDLKKLMDMTEPEVIIPMHTESAGNFRELEQFRDHKDKIEVCRPGEVYGI